MLGHRRPPAVLEPVAPGELLLPGYRAVGLLAHGRRLDTYDAWDEDRDCRVVVKLLREDRRDEPEAVASVLQEGVLVTTLAHPHLVRGFEVRDAPTPAVVLEMLTGATVGALVEDRPLSVSDTAQLGLQLVSVLGYLHRRDWLHLDVKPANVVDQHGRAVLIDLSLAGRPGLGRRGAGTRGYLAPEQALGRGPVAGHRRLRARRDAARVPDRRPAVRRRGHLAEPPPGPAGAPVAAPPSRRPARRRTGGAGPAADRLPRPRPGRPAGPGAGPGGVHRPDGIAAAP